MKATNIRTSMAAATALVIAALAGCRQPAVPNKTTIPSPAPVRPAQPPQKQPPKQVLGLEIVNAFSANKTLRDSRISVGTSGDVVTLNGTVPTEADRKAAIAMVRKKSPKAKIVDYLQVRRKPAPPATHKRP